MCVATQTVFLLKTQLFCIHTLHTHLKMRKKSVFGCFTAKYEWRSNTHILYIKRDPFRERRMVVYNKRAFSTSYVLGLCFPLGKNRAQQHARAVQVCSSPAIWFSPTLENRLGSHHSCFLWMMFWHSSISDADLYVFRWRIFVSKQTKESARHVAGGQCTVLDQRACVIICF
jgi:hypothetical protein